MSTTMILLLIIAAIIVAVLLYATTRPDSFEVSRSTTIRARPEEVFAHIASLRRMDEWNPFVKGDPALKIDYTDPDTGVGARSTFAGKRAGAGSVTITESTPAKKVVSRLEMTKPMKCDNVVEFTLTPAGEGTATTWAMRGAQPFLGKLMGVFIDCDKMVGGQFEKGLADLKTLAEKSHAPV